MISRRDTFALGSLAALAAAPAARAAPVAAAGTVDLWRAEFGSVRDTGAEGATVNGPMDLGQITTPLDPARPERGTCRLRFARFRGRGDPGAAPVFLFNGGPFHGEDLWWLYDGGLGTANTFAFIKTVLDHADLVLIDHRGTAGCIRPAIPNNALRTTLPLDRPATEAVRRAAARDLWAKLIEYQHGYGVDLAALTTPNLVNDADLIRQALGYPKVRLMGLSNGTYRAREYLRQHADVIDGALLFISHAYEKRPHPNDVRAAVARFDDAVRTDPVLAGKAAPTLEVLPEVCRRLDRAPPTIAIPKQANGSEAIVLSSEDITLYFWAFFTGSREMAAWPARLDRLRRGDYSELARMAVLGRVVGSDNASDAAYAGTAMPAPAIVRAYRAAAGDAPFLDRTISELWHDECPFPRDARPPFRHAVPITYVQGEWDTHTPAEAVQRLTEPSATIVVNRRQGHESVISSGKAAKAFGFEAPFAEAFLTGGRPAPYTQPMTFEAIASAGPAT